jgi:hypothetical protein
MITFLFFFSGRFNALTKLLEAESFMTNTLGVVVFTFLLHFTMEPGFVGMRKSALDYLSVSVSAF